MAITWPICTRTRWAVPITEKNLWEVRGRHLVWYSTEQDGGKNRLPKFVEDQYAEYGGKTVDGAEVPGYGGVYMLFPDIAITASPYSFSISKLEPVDANTTLLKLRVWSARSWLSSEDKIKDIPGYDPVEWPNQILPMEGPPAGGRRLPDRRRLGLREDAALAPLPGL